MARFSLIVWLAFLPLLAGAQKFPEHLPPEEPRNKGNAILVHLGLGFHGAGGDLRERFGNAGSFGSGVEWMSERGNYILGLNGNYFFGQEVKDDPLAILRTPEGDIIGSDQTLASVALRERGWFLGGHMGKLFAFSGKRAGLRCTLGAGWFQHKIRVQDDTNTVTQLTGDYRKGYDRLCGGLGLQQFIGWQNLAANRRANWFIGFEFHQGFTQTRRDWDFNDMRKLEGNRLDLRFGIRACWTLPFYGGKAEEIYY